MQWRGLLAALLTGSQPCKQLFADGHCSDVQVVHGGLVSDTSAARESASIVVKLEEGCELALMFIWCDDLQVAFSRCWRVPVLR